MSTKKFRCNDFCRNNDLYANPINLTFNNEKVYKTPYGGVLSFISAFVIGIWVLIQCLNVYHLDYSMILNQSITDYAQVTEIGQDQLTIASKL